MLVHATFIFGQLYVFTSFFLFNKNKYIWKYEHQRKYKDKSFDSWQEKHEKKTRAGTINIRFPFMHVVSVQDVAARGAQGSRHARMQMMG